MKIFIIFVVLILISISIVCIEAEEKPSNYVLSDGQHQYDNGNRLVRASQKDEIKQDMKDFIEKRKDRMDKSGKRKDKSNKPSNDKV